MACLDTSLLIDLCRRSPSQRLPAREKLRELGRRGETLAVTRFNVAELLVGVFAVAILSGSGAQSRPCCRGWRKHFVRLPGVIVESYAHE